MSAPLFRLTLSMAFAILLASISPVAAATPQAGEPVAEAPQATAERATTVGVFLEGTDSIGARLSTQLKERFNQSSLFHLNSEEEKDEPELRLLLSTTPEFPDRPGIGSIFSVCWVFSQGRGYLGYLLGREIGTVNAEDMPALVDKLVERTDGIAARYSNLWKK